MLKNLENNRTEEIGLVTPTPGIDLVILKYSCFRTSRVNMQYMPLTSMITINWNAVMVQATDNRGVNDYLSSQINSHQVNFSWGYDLNNWVIIHWGLNKMAAILQTTLSKTFCWMKTFLFLFKSQNFTLKVMYLSTVLSLLKALGLRRWKRVLVFWFCLVSH